MAQSPETITKQGAHVAQTACEDEEDVLFTSDSTNELQDPELGGWVYDTLQRLQPGVEISLGSVKAIAELLDGVTVAVLEEAKRISQGDAEEAGPSQGAQASAIAPKAKTSRTPPLTSLDIHKALKRLLPCNNQPGERLRPYLPAVTKNAWHLDKQSLKGVKKQKLAGEVAQQLKQAAPSQAADIDALEKME